MLQNAYFLAKIGADTAENEQHFAEILPKTGNYPTGPRGCVVAVAIAVVAVAVAVAPVSARTYVCSNCFSNFWLILGKL